MTQANDANNVAADSQALTTSIQQGRYHEALCGISIDSLDQLASNLWSNCELVYVAFACTCRFTDPAEDPQDPDQDCPDCPDYPEAHLDNCAVCEHRDTWAYRHSNAMQVQSQSFKGCTYPRSSILCKCNHHTVFGKQYTRKILPLYRYIASLTQCRSPGKLTQLGWNSGQTVHSRESPCTPEAGKA